MFSSSACSTSSDALLLRPVRGPERVSGFAEGERLAGRYSIIAPIGAGGMGTVYEAFDQVAAQVVAIKALKRPETRDHVRRFEREAASASALRHPHICQVYDLGMAKDRAFIVMERLRGETLRARLQRVGAFSVADAVAIGIQLLDALAAAHRARVLHRDVKPDNVFILTPPGESPFVKIIDFGLARHLPSDSGDVTLITVVGAIPGTPAYLSPEQLHGEQTLDEGVDIWAAGLTLFELLTGRHGFTANKLELLAQHILSSPAPAVREYRADVPVELDQVIAKALAKQRADRWPSATAFREALVMAWTKHRVSGLERSAQPWAEKPDDPMGRSPLPVLVETESSESYP